MGGIRFEADQTCNGCQVLRLENERLWIDVLPELGGKIYRFIDTRQQRDHLWQHPSIQPAILTPGTPYDDNWCGGWDDLFPSVAPVTHEGIDYPDHGEFWTQTCEWDVEQSSDTLTLYLRVDGTVTPTRLERWLTLDASSPVLRTRHRLTHLGGGAFDFLWALHPALAIGPTHQFLIPAQSGLVASPGQGRFAENAARFDWPTVPGRDGKSIDLSLVPSSRITNGYEMVYLTELSAGWFALRDRSTRSGFGMAFDEKIFDSIWIFQTCGGWRGLHVAVIEACTGYPEDVAQASAAGRCPRLEPAQCLETHTTAIAFSDRDQVNGIDLNGEVS